MKMMIVKGSSPPVALLPELRPTCSELPRSSCCYKTWTCKPNIVIYTEALEGTKLNNNPTTSAQGKKTRKKKSLDTMNRNPVNESKLK